MDFSDLPRVGQPFDVVSIGSIKNIKENHKTQDLQGDDRGAIMALPQCPWGMGHNDLLDPNRI